MSDGDAMSPERDPPMVRVPYHVYPVGQGHFTDGEPCWCKPQREEGGWLVIHNQAVA